MLDLGGRSLSSQRPLRQRRPSEEEAEGEWVFFCHSGPRRAAGRQAARHSSGLQSEEGERVAPQTRRDEVTCSSGNTCQLSGGTILIVCSLESPNPDLRSVSLPSCVSVFLRDTSGNPTRVSHPQRHVSFPLLHHQPMYIKTIIIIVPKRHSEEEALPSDPPLRLHTDTTTSTSA